LCRVSLLKNETRGIFLHSVEPPLDHKSLLAVVDPGTLVILPTAACQLELFLAACSIPRIPRFEKPVMARAHIVLLREPIHIFCHVYMIFFCVFFICIYDMLVSIKSSVQMGKRIFTYICIHTSYHRSCDCTVADCSCSCTFIYRVCFWTNEVLRSRRTK